MEVKVKDGNLLIDADVSLENGVMIVTPKSSLSTSPKEWKPRIGEQYFVPYFEQDEGFYFYALDNETYEGYECEDFVKYVPCFKTKEECEDYANKLNEAIRGVQR